LRSAVHRNKPLSRAGVLERLFTVAFRGLVYPQIWEDPVVDLAALELGPKDRVITIASGGCNALSYLTADPAEIVAVDLNGAHVALGRLKLAALRHLPDYEAFLRYLGRAASRASTNCEVRLVSITRTQSAVAKSRIGRRCWMPALPASTSNRP